MGKIDLKLSSEVIVAPSRKLKANWTLESAGYSHLHDPPDQSTFAAIIKDICNSIEAEAEAAFAVNNGAAKITVKGLKHPATIICDNNGIFKIGDDYININNPKFFEIIKLLIFKYCYIGGADNELMSIYDNSFMARSMARSIMDDIDKEILNDIDKEILNGKYT
jgi:hypothetical protein